MDTGLKVYVVACCADPSCIVVAENAKQAEKIAKKQADKDLGDCDDHWKAEEWSKYFEGEYEPNFFGWIQSSGQVYLKS